MKKGDESDEYFNKKVLHKILKEEIINYLDKEEGTKGDVDVDHTIEGIEEDKMDICFIKLPMDDIKVVVIDETMSYYDFSNKDLFVEVNLVQREGGSK